MKVAQMPCACTIAGSDSGGGAGIQADLKTFSALGVWGCSVITAITAQNPACVKGIWNIDPDAVTLQIEAVLEEFLISAFKTGMLPTQEIVRAVSDSLPKDIPLVIDPVMISTSGKTLADDAAFSALKDLLLPKCTLITPNIPEACALSGIDCINCEEDMIAAGNIIRNMGAENVLIKGGHMSGLFSDDMLISSFGIKKLSGKRFPFEIHGSGCSLSSAITAGLCRGYNVERSCENAKTFINSAIKHAFISKSGYYNINPIPINVFLSNNKHYISKN
ncbi:MAG: bifunctional hydroxymethylpyrimidine kinase/phosphomethylpyrimidine kinase [Methanomicrobium sp.]|nr:bifunctional hydroxymethylpyrimidine kinase/phosphomethylpyrimidine kinase [Methanomicrobium sp.]